MGNTKCNPEAPTLKWNPEIWAADSESQSIVRGDQVIRTKDPRFDQFISMRSNEIPKFKEAYFEVINQCEKWKPNANIKEIGEAYETLGIDKGMVQEGYNY